MENKYEPKSQLLFSFVLLLLIFISFGINPSQGKSGGDNNYLIKFTHTKESCLSALEKISQDNEKLLSKIDWGCMSGDHTGYMMVSGKDEKAVKDMIPKSILDQVTIEKVDKFTKKQIESFHK
jgi:hypothetical protein